jgi:hypothetical protein
MADLPPGSGRNARSVWSISTQPYSKAHFATFPEELPRRCILAGTSERGCCPQCGTPWQRVIETQRVRTRPGKNTKCNVPAGWAVGGGSHATVDHMTEDGQERRRENLEIGNRDPGRHVSVRRTIGWKPGCDCIDEASTGESCGPDIAHEPVPCVVLDPFGGSGTTGAVALQLGREAVLCELNREYVEDCMIDRLGEVLIPQGRMESKATPSDAPLFANPEQSKSRLTVHRRKMHDG